MFQQLKKRFIPAEIAGHPDLFRRAGLLISFGIMGAIFGSCFAAFYLMIGHVWGAAVVAVCSVSFMAVPFILRATRQVFVAGNIYTGILFTGFLILTGIEGGATGHALAWLSTVPLCALLLVDQKSSIFWGVLSILAAVSFALLLLLGVAVPRFYPPELHDMITAVGYAALPPFLALFGYLFESGRRLAFERMQRAVEDLSEANEGLTRLNQEKNEFLGIAAHDLKNPLNQISMGAEIILGDHEDPDTAVNKCATIIVRASRRMTSLITNLLDINAIEEGKMNLRPGPVEAVPLLQEVISFYQEAARRKEIVLQLDPPAVELVMHSDRDATVQVIDNLISNAIKYSPLKSAVALRLLVDGDRAIVEIADQGPGLSDEDKLRLFQKFARLGPRPTAGESSNGLGLSIVKRLAEAMGGTVGCRSQVGEGSTFILVLPLFRNGSAVSPAPAARP